MLKSRHSRETEITPIQPRLMYSQTEGAILCVVRNSHHMPNPDRHQMRQSEPQAQESMLDFRIKGVTVPAIRR